MSDEIPASQLSIIVDLTSTTFNIKKLYDYLNTDLKLTLEHHYWHFGGLRSYTTQFNTNDDEILIKNLIEQLKHLQIQTSLFAPFWITHKICSPDQPISPCEIIKKYQKKFYTDKKFQIEFTSGSLIQLNQYVYDPNTYISDVYCLTFYYDRIEFDYGQKEKPLRKTLKTSMMDRCAITMTDQNQFTIFFNMNGNAIDYEGIISNDEINPGEKKISYQRTAPLDSQSFYSTIRIIIKILDDNQDNISDNYQRLKKCHNYFLDYFQRNYIHDCFGLIESCSTRKDLLQLKLDFMTNNNLSFIKKYCWHMLLSLGYRFQQRLKDEFINYLNLIDDDDEFYQTSLHLWRRSNEYYFLDLLAELHRYQEKIANLASLIINQNLKEETKPERWSLHNPPKHYAYVPSVTLTPTTICVKPFKLVKTNRVLREKRFGDKLMFALVDIKDENGTIDLFPHDYRALRTKISMLLEYGFDLGCQGRTYRYLHHSQSQLKDKQFWFYHHDGRTNFSFEEAFAWMGDFQEERIVAKHAARIAQCFTSAEETIPIPSEKVEYIKDIHTDDNKYNFTDGVGTMSTLIRNKINPHRQFSAIQIRYGGCKGVISVNPDLDNSPHQLRIRNSMKKFECSHVMLELCRISKPRPLYLNRQIIVLLSHRKIDDRIFLLLQNKHEKFLSESLVYPERAYELLSEKLNRNLFPLPALIHHARLNLIQEPFFRQLLITTGKFELAQMKERTRLKLPKNKARNMIGIVDEYGILEYGQVFIQYTELTGDYINSTESEKTIILEQKVVVTKNPCHHPGDIRVFDAIDVPRLRHLKDVIVFPQRGKRPHPNEISGSDLDGDEYAVIWHPAFIPQTPNDTPYDYDSQVPMLRVDRPVNRTDIRNTVLDISEQSCAGKLCSIHLAFVDRYGVADEQTLKIAGYISEELDAPKTGQHPLTPRQIVQLQEELKNERPDYFDKPYYKLYPSEHVLGQLFRSCLRFEPNWINVQTPPTTTYPAPIDPLLVHDKQHEYRTSVEELARIYRECIMDIMYVYRFSSDVDLLCRFDSSIPQHRAPLAKQQTESACLVADSAQVELRQLIRRTERLFYDDLPSCEQHDSKHSDATCSRCSQRKRAAMAKASALYIFCYTDTHHARRMLSLPWLFATLLIKVRKLNIEKQSKLLSPTHISQMLEIQPYRLIGQSLLQGVQYFLRTKTSFYFHHIYTNDKPNQVTISLRRTSETKRLFLKRELCLLDYLLIEIFQHYVFSSLSQIRSPLTDSKPNLLDSVWQHILTRFILQKPSKLVLLTSTINENKNLLNIQDYQFWSDEQAWTTLQRLIQISAECANEYSNDMIDDEYSEDIKEKAIDYVHANEYLISILQKMATTGCLFS